MGSKLMWHQGLKFLRLTSPLFVDQVIEVFAFRADSKLVFLSEWCSSTEFCIASKDSDQWMVCWGSRVLIPAMRRWTGAVPVPRDGMERASYLQCFSLRPKWGEKSEAWMELCMVGLKLTFTRHTGMQGISAHTRSMLNAEILIPAYRPSP